MAENQSNKLPRRVKTDLTGKRFERWVVLSMCDDGNPMIKWTCRCDCGTILDVTGNNLKRGLSRSCGCLKRELAGTHSITHGMTESPEYRKWRSAKLRCFTPSTARYPMYGGRGITMRDAWRDSFEQFFADMGECPKGMELDRIDVNGNYEPGNCRWVTRSENMRNRQNAIHVIHEGKTIPLKELSERSGIKYETLVNRLKHRLPLLAPVGPTSQRSSD